MTQYHVSFGNTPPETIEERMLIEWPEYDVATCALTKGKLPERLDDNLDSSFSRQIRELTSSPYRIDPILQTTPDAFVVTANTAIPVAASVRGYYEAAGKPCPPITYIEADRKRAWEYFIAKSISEAEITRLTKLFEGVQHVCVIDQTVVTGETIQLAAELLYVAGVKTVSGIRGKWYSYINPKHVHKEPLYSRVDPFMRHIGMQAINKLVFRE